MKNYNILIKFPTRQRKNKFFEILDLYYGLLENNKDTYFLISCDKDDKEMNNVDVINKLKKYKNLEFYFGNNKSKIEAINADIDKTNVKWDILLLASDDMIPQIKGYDDIIREKMHQNYSNTDGVLWFHDGIQKDLNTLSILGKKYYDRFGYIYHPSYYSLWCDNEFHQVAELLKKQFYIDQCIIKHEHPAWGYGKNDELLNRNDTYNKDKFIFERRKSVFFCLEPKLYKRCLLNDKVDEVYIINLERRKDRLEHIKKEFDKKYINYKIFKAFDGMDMKTKEDLLIKSIKATVKSHTGVIKDAVKNKYNTIAVFEDDISLCEDFDERLKLYMNNIPEDWEIMYLGCHFNSCKYPILIKNNVYKVDCCYGCFAMLLNNKKGIFQKILDNVTENTPYDNFINGLLSTTKAYVFMPFFVKTIKTTSDISERTDSFSYDVVNQYYQDRFIPEKTKIIEVVQQPKLPLNQPPPPHPPKIEYVKSNQEICEDFLRSNVSFQIYHMGRLIFDSDTADKSNLYFYRDNFTLYGRNLSYQGMAIRKK